MLLTVLCVGWFGVTAPAQTNAFTYQGRLNLAGAPATGVFDLQFSLFDAPTAGIQNGATITNLATPVTNGLFTATLDFGDAVFSGSPRWLEIAVHSPSDPNYTILAPRQALTSTPYAIRAANYSGNLPATNLTGKILDANLSANVALLTNPVVFTRNVTASNFIGNGINLTNLSATNLIGTVPDARLATNIARLNSNAIFAGSLTATQFIGNGISLTNLSTTNLVGTVPDARLSTNIARLNGNAIFAGSLTATQFIGSGVASTNFVGNGRGLTNVPGRIFEVIPTGVNVQAAANTGYLATNPTTAVVVTLPPTTNISVGETVRVSGSGAGGWVIAQNAGQVVLVGTLQDTFGQSWELRDSSRLWRGVASSADGSKLVAVVNGGFVYTSTDYGANWTAHDSSRNWRSVASSGDGGKLVAAASEGIFTSVNSGTNWSIQLGAANWTSVASSLDGGRLVATLSGVGIYTSTDSGLNWTPRSGSANWVSVASSDNGMNLVAAVQGLQIYTSTNGGTNWVARDSNRNWISVASSADGSRLVAAVNSGLIYVSSDYGTNWMASGAPNLAWTSVATAKDGAQMAAVYNLGGLYLSEDSGLTWVQRLALPNTVGWTGITMSSDASTIAAVGSASQIYISSQATTTTGTSGSLRGTRLSAVELIHCGNGVFMPISSQGTIRAQ